MDDKLTLVVGADTSAMSRAISRLYDDMTYRALVGGTATLQEPAPVKTADEIIADLMELFKAHVRPDPFRGPGSPLRDVISAGSPQPEAQLFACSFRRKMPKRAFYRWRGRRYAR